MSYADWQVSQAPPWLQDQWGTAWLRGHGATKDDYLQQFIAAVKASFPEAAPPDALPALGDEYGLDQGPTESNDDFATRLRQARIYWKLAGTPAGLLAALHFAGLTGAVIVQQNGLQYTLTEPYTAGTDPSLSVNVSNTAALVSTLTSSVAPYRTIPAGTPWFFFDSNTDFCSRFAVIAPKWPFSALAWATFNNSDSAVVTFPFTFPDANYGLVYGMPSDNVVLSEDGTVRSTTQATIRASAPWTGSVPVIAWESGVNPLNFFSDASVGALKNTIKKWKPAKATCMGVLSIVSGRVLGYGGHTLGDGGVLGGSVSQILGAF